MVMWCRKFLDTLHPLNLNAFVFLLSFLRDVLAQASYNRCVCTPPALSGILDFSFILFLCFLLMFILLISSLSIFIIFGSRLNMTSVVRILFTFLSITNYNCCCNVIHIAWSPHFLLISIFDPIPFTVLPVDRPQLDYQLSWFNL
jgi:hypothetical protein